MSTEEFIINVFCLIDDELKALLNGRRLRQRGFEPVMTDSEVMTMEVVGETLGYDNDKSLWHYFKTHWKQLFPKIPERTTFVRQAANLHELKHLLQTRIAAELGGYADRLHIIDGLPMPVCKFARAAFSRIFKENAAYGYCASKQETYYGFHGHIVISSRGVITAATFAAANIDERDVCPELVEKIRGILLGDKGFIRPILNKMLGEQELWMLGTRRLVETVIGQLAERFHIERVRARDIWHQASRFWRKILAHTLCVKINLRLGNEPLQFEKLVAA